MGVKVVKGDQEDVSSYAPHLEGMHGAFVNADCESLARSRPLFPPHTNFTVTETVLPDWAKYFGNGFDAKGARAYESNLSRSAVDACVKAGIKHIIYSTLDSMPKDVNCEHRESKADGTSQPHPPCLVKHDEGSLLILM